MTNPSKAFYCIDHEPLNAKMHASGFDIIFKNSLIAALPEENRR